MKIARLLWLAVGIGAALPVAPTVARKPKPSVCQSGRFVLPQGILVEPATLPSKAIVIADVHSISIPGVCPVNPAKLVGTRRGTRVAVRWPTGVCTGITGTLRLTALVEPTCHTMQGKLLAKKLRRPFIARLPACDPGFVQNSGGACEPVPFQTGTATTPLTLDAAGCLAEAAGLSTPLGVHASLVAGTCFRTVDDAAVSGGVELGLDDGGGPAALGSGADVKGAVRLFVRPSGSAAVAAVIAPPATLDLELGSWSLPGTWYTTVYLSGDRIVAGPVAGAVPMLLDAVPMEADGPEHLRLDATGPVALQFTAAPLPAAATTSTPAPAVTGPSTVSIVVPGAPTDTEPKVCAWQLVNPATGQIVVAGSQQDGIALGGSDARLRAGHAYTAALTASGGQRVLAVTSDFQNRFAVHATLCDGQDVAAATHGGCAGEDCTGGPYVGFVRVTAQGSTDADITAVRDALAAKAPPPTRLIVRHLTSPPGGGRQAIIDVEAPSSVHLLVAGMPSVWQVSTGDRTIDVTVRQPVPPSSAHVVKRISEARVSAQVASGTLGDDTKEKTSPTSLDLGAFSASLPASIRGDLDADQHVALAASVLHDAQLDVTAGTILLGVSGTVAVSATDSSTGIAFPDFTSQATALGRTEVWFDVEDTPVAYAATLDVSGLNVCDARLELWIVPTSGSPDLGSIVFDTDDGCDEASFPLHESGTLPIGHYLFRAQGSAVATAGGFPASDAVTASFGLTLGTGS